MADYTHGDLAEGLGRVGVSLGDTIFCHSNIGFFGKIEGGNANEQIFQAFTDVIDPGSLCVPQFTYTQCGSLSDYVAVNGECAFWDEPMCRIAATGRDREYLTGGQTKETFGPNSFWSRFLEMDGKFVNLNFDAGSTFIHFCERELGVPYRQNRQIKSTQYYSRDLNDPSATPRFERFDELARQAGYVKEARVGRGSIVSISARDTYKLIAETLPKEPYFLIERGKNG